MQPQTVACEGCGQGIVIVDPSTPRLCQTCAGKAGLAYPQPPRRPLVPCARCGHDELLRVMPRERTSDDGGANNREVAVPMALTYATGSEIRDLFDWTRVPSARPELGRPFGVLETWVCRRCGFVEWYAQSPEQIPIGAPFGTTLVKVPQRG